MIVVVVVAGVVRGRYLISVVTRMFQSRISGPVSRAQSMGFTGPVGARVRDQQAHFSRGLKWNWRGYANERPTGINAWVCMRMCTHCAPSTHANMQVSILAGRDFVTMATPVE